MQQYKYFLIKYGTIGQQMSEILFSNKFFPQIQCLLNTRARR